MGDSHMWTRSVCFAGIRGETKTGASSSFYFPSSFFFLPPVSFPADFFFFFFSPRSQFHCRGNLHFRGQFPCLSLVPWTLADSTSWSTAVGRSALSQLCLILLDFPVLLFNDARTELILLQDRLGRNCVSAFTRASSTGSPFNLYLGVSFRYILPPHPPIPPPTPRVPSRFLSQHFSSPPTLTHLLPVATSIGWRRRRHGERTPRDSL